MFKKGKGKKQGSRELYAFGWNNHGQLGLGDLENVSEPKQILHLAKTGITQITCGWNHSAALSENGDVLTWGNGMDGQLGHGDSLNLVLPCRVAAAKKKGIIEVSCGGFHTILVRPEGSTQYLYSFGLGLHGRLGHGNTESMGIPKRVDQVCGIFREVSCGSDHSGAVTNDGVLVTWGLGKDGRLGHGNEEDVYVPKVVEALRQKRVKGVSCGSDFTVVLTESGEVYSWGTGSNGRLGHGDNNACRIPKLVEGCQGLGIKQVCCGADHVVALSESGKVYCWGYSANGRTGLGRDDDQPTPALVETLSGCSVVFVAAGGHHSAAILDNKDVYTWGWNFYGQLGYTGVEEQRTPKLVPRLQGKSVRHVACGEGHTLVMCG